MTRPLVIADEARVELRDAALFYETERPGLGGELLEAVEAVFEALRAGTAASGSVPGVKNELGIRRVLLSRFPFAVVHVEEDGLVHVIAIAHLRREPGYWLARGQP